jgi:hypothetical protein
MAARGGPRVFPALRAHVEKHAARLSVAEAEAAGRALAHASARLALDAFGEWLRPKDAGFLGKLVKVLAGPPVQRVALAGLREIGGPEAEELLRLLAAHGDPALRPEAAAALEARGKAPSRG